MEWEIMSRNLDSVAKPNTILEKAKVKSKLSKKVAGPVGFDPTTTGSGGLCSLFLQKRNSTLS
jgi:hypothetical protein